MKRVGLLLSIAALTASLGACRAVLGIDPLELVDGGTDATAEAGEAGGDVTVETSADADASGDADAFVDAAAPDADAAVEADATAEAETSADADAAHDADATADAEAAIEAEAGAEAAAEAEASVSDAAGDGDAGEAADAPDAASEIAACVDAGMMECFPCCEMSFPAQHMNLISVAINDSCICGTGQCSTQCSGTICPPGGGMPPPNCDMCVTSAIVTNATSACQQTTTDCQGSPSCAAVLQCLKACP